MTQAAHKTRRPGGQAARPRSHRQPLSTTTWLQGPSKDLGKKMSPSPRVGALDTGRSVTRRQAQSGNTKFSRMWRRQAAREEAAPKSPKNNI